MLPKTGTGSISKKAGKAQRISMKKTRKVGKESYANRTSKVLKQVHAEAGISPKETSFINIIMLMSLSRVLPGRVHRSK